VSGGFDVDFLVQTRPKTLASPRQFVAIEAKLGAKFKPRWVSGLRTLLGESARQVRKAFLVYTGRDHLQIDGIDVMPAGLFLEELHAGKVVG